MTRAQLKRKCDQEAQRGGFLSLWIQITCVKAQRALRLSAVQKRRTEAKQKGLWD